MSLKVGKAVPDFSLVADNGKPYKLSNKIKNKVLLVFYPGDGTPVCTNQFADFRNNEEKFKKLDVEIIGISSNDSKYHQSFKKEHNIPFTLLTDEKGQVASDYNCLGMFGIKRGIFLVDNKMQLKYSHIESVSIFRRNSDEIIDLIKKYS
ncbi:MAG: peroxiredoxin [Gammaproteobacteria bacterium]|nr:peroxiredoxin [Xanthomonadales bacterium]